MIRHDHSWHNHRHSLYLGRRGRRRGINGHRAGERYPGSVVLGAHHRVDRHRRRGNLAPVVCAEAIGGLAIGGAVSP